MCRSSEVPVQGVEHLRSETGPQRPPVDAASPSRRRGGTTHPAPVATWESRWAEFAPFLGPSIETQRSMPSTNGLELNAQESNASCPDGTQHLHRR